MILVILLWDDLYFPSVLQIRADYVILLLQGALSYSFGILF